MHKLHLQAEILRPIYTEIIITVTLCGGLETKCVFVSPIIIIPTWILYITQSAIKLNISTLNSPLLGAWEFRFKAQMRKPNLQNSSTFLLTLAIDRAKQNCR